MSQQRAKRGAGDPPEEEQAQKRQSAQPQPLRAGTLVSLPRVGGVPFGLSKQQAAQRRLRRAKLFKKSAVYGGGAARVHYTNKSMR